MEQIGREYTLNYPIEKIKESIESISADVTNKYPLTDKNETPNSYSLNVFFGLLHTIPVSIQLNKISDTETKVMLSGVISPAVQ